MGKKNVRYNKIDEKSLNRKNDRKRKTRSLDKVSREKTSQPGERQVEKTGKKDKQKMLARGNQLKVYTR